MTTGVSMGPRDAARATGVSTDTLRHYERLGLLPGIGRTAAGYRRYSAATVARVHVIQRALGIGFSLKDLKRVLTVRDAGGAPCRTVRALVGERLGELNQRLEELQDLRNHLTALVADWDRILAETPPGRRAHLLDALAAAAPKKPSGRFLRKL